MGWAADRIAEDIRWLGLDEMSIRSDGESAMLALKDNIRMKGIRLVPEESPVGQSASNGTAERAVQQIEGQVRTVKLALEDRLQADIPSGHPVMAWLVSHAADLLGKFGVGRDGRTGYERMKGKSYSGTHVEFGAKVHAKLPSTRGA